MKNKRAVLAAVGVLVLIGLMLMVYTAFKPQTVQGQKTLTVKVIAEDEVKNEIEIMTDAEYLRDALEENRLIEGDDGEFGMFIKSVDGIKADEDKQEWWCITKGGQRIDTGVDDTPIANGETYELTLTAGW